MASNGPSALAGPIDPAAVLQLCLLGQQAFTPDRGNVVVKLDRQGTHPYFIMLPYTADEARKLDADHWAATWRGIRAWSGAPGLKQEQWLLLWSLFRTLHWFAQLNDGEVGRHFTFTRPIREDLLLRFLHTWIRERIPEVFVAAIPGIDLPDYVLARVQQEI
ncbi:hypothetical protein GSI_08557 [Ganoderma sinense ZZ0214-1]|uniref:Uncharacterized protein n=1 Tax=Ganoderma sinense ZZ0214-1 TaxID=1077348 RepID=A0A2G8S416_9APHY|nr:hypothetical protein GSI_08557 [Ganoderma sinense ZZ0214-1]